MSRSVERELAQEVIDRNEALSCIGRVLRDETLGVRRRIDQVLGIVGMYEPGPKVAHVRPEALTTRQPRPVTKVGPSDSGPR